MNNIQVYKKDYQGWSLSDGVLVEGNYDYQVGDIVISISTGLEFRVENAKMWTWMQQSKNFVKEIRNENM